MKKFMFTAIAMIAFVGSSMANTSEVQKNLIVIEKSCEEEGADYLLWLDPHNTLSPTQAHDAYKEYVDRCNRAPVPKKLVNQITPTNP